MTSHEEDGWGDYVIYHKRWPWSRWQAVYSGDRATAWAVLDAVVPLVWGTWIGRQHGSKP